MKFVCLGYIEEDKWSSLSAEEGQRMMEECFRYDDELRRGGHFLGGEALDTARNAVTLRIRGGQLDVTDGPYAETKEMLGGILLLEARDLNHAILLMSRHPGVATGPFEIRPANEQINQLIAERDAAVAGERFSQTDDTTSIGTLTAALNFAYEWIRPLAHDLADAPLTSPTAAGGNHPLWIMGHITFSSAWLAAMISGQENPYVQWKTLFSGGTEPLPDPARYPPYSEILEAYDATHHSLVQLLGEIGDAGLKEAPIAVREQLRSEPDFQSSARLFMFIAMHEMSHRGQLADARRMLGRRPFA